MINAINFFVVRQLLKSPLGGRGKREERARDPRYAKGDPPRSFDQGMVMQREERQVMQLRGKEQLDGDLEAL